MPNSDFTINEQKALTVIKNGNALTKVIKRHDVNFLQFITEFLKNPQAVKQKLINPASATTREHAVGLTFDKTSELVITDEQHYTFTPSGRAKKKKPDNFTKSTSTTLLSTTGKAALFVGTMPGEAVINSAESYQIGLLFDYHKTQPAKFAFFKNDGFTSLKPWRKRDSGAVFNRLADFIRNRLPSFEATKAFVAQHNISTTYSMTEIYTRVSKESLLGITIRSEEYFKRLNTRILSFVEKIKMGNELNIEDLPIIVLNNPDNNTGAKPYPFAQQKEDFETYLNNLKEEGLEPEQHFQETFGISLQVISDHVNKIRPLNAVQEKTQEDIKDKPIEEVSVQPQFTGTDQQLNESIPESPQQPFFKTKLGIFIISFTITFVILAIVLTALFLTHVIVLPTIAATAITSVAINGISGAAANGIGYALMTMLIGSLLGSAFFISKNRKSPYRDINCFNEAQEPISTTSYGKMEALHSEQQSLSSANQLEREAVYSSLFVPDINVPHETYETDAPSAQTLK